MVVFLDRQLDQVVDLPRDKALVFERLLKGIQFLMETDLQQVFDKVSPGNNQVVEISGKEVFAIFQEYDSKAPDQAKMEGHKKYIDIQYLHQGEEYLLIGCIENVTQKGIYDEDNDIHFSEVETETSLKTDRSTVPKRSQIPGP